MKTANLFPLLLLLAGCTGNTPRSPAPHPMLPATSDASALLRRADAMCKAQRETARVAVQIDELNLPLLVKPLSCAAGGRSNVVSVITSLLATGTLPSEFSAIVTIPEMQPIVDGTNIVLALLHDVDEDLRRLGATQVVYQCFLHYGFWANAYANGLPPLIGSTEGAEQNAAPIFQKPRAVAENGER